VSARKTVVPTDNERKPKMIEKYDNAIDAVPVDSPHPTALKKALDRERGLTNS